MKAKIKAEINSGQCPVWLSPTVSGERLHILQNFFLTLEKSPSYDEAGCADTAPAGPGEIPCVFLRGFSEVVSKDAFEGAVFTHSDDENWKWEWANGSDLKFSYSDPEASPLENIGDKCTFSWRNFYTGASPEAKKAELTVEAYDIPGCADGIQGRMSVSFAYPAYIISFQPNEQISEGIVCNDRIKRRCVVSKGGTVSLSWNGAADFTDETALKKNGIKLTGAFTINGSYDVTDVTESGEYELTVTNSYRFSHSLSYGIDKTDWKKKEEQKSFFQGDVYGFKDCNPQIFTREKALYAYCHPFLYKKEKEGEWKSVSENTLYKGSEHSFYASHLYGSSLYCAVGIKGTKQFSLCRCNTDTCKWEEDKGYIQLPYKEDDVPMCCGFAASEHREYFYFAEKGLVTVCAYNRYFKDWQHDGFYVNAPDGAKLIGASMIFRIDCFYMAMLCGENNGSGEKSVYLYDCSNETEECLMKKKVSDGTTRIDLLKTANTLWIATDREIIDCGDHKTDSLFYPALTAEGKAWFGYDEDNIFGVFPDKHLWIYDRD